MSSERVITLGQYIAICLVMFGLGAVWGMTLILEFAR